MEILLLLTHTDLPGRFHSIERIERGECGELWLSEGQTLLIEPSYVRGHISVWLKDMECPQQYDYNVQEIIYTWRNHYRIRPIEKRHHHPAEYIPPNLLPSNQRTLKIFIDLYHDDFGTFRTVYHSLGGVYVQFGNMTKEMRRQIKNHFPVGFVPFGGNFKDFIKPFVEELDLLQKGMWMKCAEGDAWVIAGLGCVTADLPQGNIHAGVKNHNANFGCRMCKAPRGDLTNPAFDVLANGRYHHQTDLEIAEINSLQGTARIQMSKQYGLHDFLNPLDRLLRDRHLQTPHDVYHAVAGKVMKLLEETLNLLSKSGEETFLLHWKGIEKPQHWSHLPNPLQHLQSFMFSDVL